MTPEEEALRRLVDLFEAHRIPYMFTGSVASSHHGRPRATHDADVVIDPTAAEDSILSKLEWARHSGESERQLRDAAGVVELNPSLDVAYIERWARELGVLDLWQTLSR